MLQIDEFSGELPRMKWINPSSSATQLISEFGLSSAAGDNPIKQVSMFV
jgi:hypothetical protein